MSTHPASFPELAPEPERSSGQSADGVEDREAQVVPAPAPIAGDLLEPDTWMTFGLGADGAQDDRVVTVVFSHPTDDSTEFLGGPFRPVFPEN
ncbi:MAG TPA: hypothetical protein VMG60_07890 [Burkholderiaceae bacterium]|nr:hypothetical protein [Burkholderiaceae bacterium]